MQMIKDLRDQTDRHSSRSRFTLAGAGQSQEGPHPTAGVDRGEAGRRSRGAGRRAQGAVSGCVQLGTGRHGRIVGVIPLDQTTRRRHSPSLAWEGVKARRTAPTADLRPHDRASLVAGRRAGPGEVQEVRHRLSLPMKRNGHHPPGRRGIAHYSSREYGSPNALGIGSRRLPSPIRSMTANVERYGSILSTITEVWIPSTCARNPKASTPPNR